MTCQVSLCLSIYISKYADVKDMSAYCLQIDFNDMLSKVQYMFNQIICYVFDHMLSNFYRSFEHVFKHVQHKPASTNLRSLYILMCKIQ